MLAPIFQKKLIAFVNSHGGIFATPTHDGGCWIYIRYSTREGGAGVDRFKAKTFSEAKAHLGY